MEQTYYNEMKCHFNLRQPKSSRPTKVYCVVYVDGKQLKLSTGLKVYSSQWDKYKQCAIIDNRMNEESKRNNLILNDKIIAMRKQFSEIKLYICNHLETNITLMIKTMNKEESKVCVFKQFEDALNDYVGGKQNESTRKQYISEWATVKELFNVEKYEEVDFKRFDNFKNKYINKGATTLKGYKGIILNVLKVMRKKDIYDYSKLISEIEEVKFPSTRVKDDGKIALTKEETQLVENLQYNESSKLDKERWQLVKDAFLFMCYTGLRVSDACQNFNDKKDIALNKGRFEVMQQKEKRSSNAIVSFALNSRIKEILDAHNWNLSYKYTRNIGRDIRKVLSSINEFNEVRQFKKQKGNRTDEFMDNMINQIAAHTGRRSFITEMCRKGFSAEATAMYTGHTDLDMINEIYNKTTKDEKLDMIEKKHNLKSKPQNNDNDMDEDDEVYIYTSNNAKDYYKMKFVDALDELQQYHNNGIDMFETNKQLISAVICKIRNVRTKTVNEKYTSLIWYICVNKEDVQTYRLWQMKAGIKVDSTKDIKQKMKEETNEIK